MRFWTLERRSAFVTAYRAGGYEAVQALFPGQSRANLRWQASRFGLTRPTRWSPEEDERLLQEWSEHGAGCVVFLGAGLGRSARAIEGRARQLGKTSAIPAGCESIQEAADRVGVDWNTLRGMLRREEARVSRVFSVRLHKRSLKLYVRTEEVDQAVRAWLSEEWASQGAQRRGLPWSFVLHWLAARGVDVRARSMPAPEPAPPRPARAKRRKRGRGLLRPPWRVESRHLDEAAAWFATAEMVSEAAARHGLPLVKTVRWLRGLPGFGERPRWVQAADVDRVVRDKRADLRRRLDSVLYRYLYGKAA